MALLLFHALCACNANSSTTSSKPAKKDRYDLSINGYNYTSRYIDQFSVNGAGGGNIQASGPTSGGGGSVCCATYYADVPGLKYKVRWQSDACRYVSFVSDSGENVWSHHLFYKEREVTPVVRAVGKPAFMEVHIYPDDHVETFITNTLSAPRLKLNKERSDKSEYPRCPNDQKPE
ncbi:DUF3304 domain-containing protein [Massilia eburnea]|uniref:DUF3304 domain-containing protein n=1 Tax=Massilia eburnea TaxID=1776165 RepID=UPI001BA4B435|nr:DUF3304 domain-containing protein [Massilia eburnea]